MIGHCGVVICQRRSVSSCGSSIDLGAADVRLQLAVLHEDAAPDDLARLADALQAAAAEAEVHRRLPLADRAGVPADEMLRRHGARNLEDPDELARSYASP